MEVLNGQNTTSRRVPRLAVPVGFRPAIFAQNDADAEADGDVVRRVDKINQMINYELQVANSVSHLNEKQQDVLSRDLKPLVAIQSQLELPTAQLRTRVQASLATSIHRLLGEEFSQLYDADREARKRFRKEAYVRSAIVVVDEMVALTASQRERMADLFGSLFLLNLKTPDYFFFDCDLDVPKGDAGKAIKKILSKSQYELWDDATSISDTRLDPETTAKREKAIRAAGELRAAWLANALEFTEAHGSGFSWYERRRLSHHSNCSRKPSLFVVSMPIYRIGSWFRKSGRASHLT